MLGQGSCVIYAHSAGFAGARLHPAYRAREQVGRIDAALVRAIGANCVTTEILIEETGRSDPNVCRLQLLAT